MLFPFGFGLSYTDFEYSNLKLEQSNKIIVSVTVRNTGQLTGKEIVQLYVQDKECSIPRSLRELKGFEKVSLNPREAKEVSFTLENDAFAFWSPTEKK